MMKAWSKYSQVLNDPVRNLNMRLTFQNGEVTMVQSHHPANVRCFYYFLLYTVSYFQLICCLTSCRLNTFSQESVLVNASVPLQLDYDEESVMASATDNETRSEFLEEQQNVKMHTPALTYDIPSLPQNVEVTLSGTGCAILQVETLLINGISLVSIGMFQYIISLQTKVYWKTLEPPIFEESLVSLYTSVEGSELSDNEEPPMALNVTICVK
jgi:uncharacterized protein YcfL